jgi:hypothetical protein
MPSQTFAVAVALLALFGCNEAGKQAERYPVRLLAFDDQGEKVAGVAIAFGDQALGSTAQSGMLELELAGGEGDRVQLQASCPEGFAEPSEQPSLTLMRFQSVDPEADRFTTLRVVCARSAHIAVVALRSGQPDLPVLLRGEEVARTSSTGTAHVIVENAPGTQFQLTLDTSQKPDLRPHSPTRMFSVGAGDDFSVWDQAFAQAPKPKPRVRKKRAPEPEPQRVVPYRLD